MFGSKSILGNFQKQTHSLLCAQHFVIYSDEFHVVTSKIIIKNEDDQMLPQYTPFLKTKVTDLGGNRH